MSTLYYSDRSLATRYEVSRSTIWRWLREGKLPQPYKINGTTRWTEEQLIKFEREQGVR